MQNHFNILGHKVRDTVTGATGVVTSISFDLYGCVQAILTQGMKDDGSHKEQYWFDVKRLKVLSKKPVMNAPNFSLPEIGAAPKPTFTSQPVR